jgi:hypothetical protein
MLSRDFVPIKARMRQHGVDLQAATAGPGTGTQALLIMDVDKSAWRSRRARPASKRSSRKSILARSVFALGLKAARKRVWLLPFNASVDGIGALFTGCEQAAGRACIVDRRDAARGHYDVYVAKPTGGNSGPVASGCYGHSVAVCIGPDFGDAFRSLIGWRTHAGEDLFFWHSYHAGLRLRGYLGTLKRHDSQNTHFDDP